MTARIIIAGSAKAVDKAFDYAVPEELCGKIEIGSRVVAPFSRGNREVEGFCVGLKDTNAEGLKSILYIADEAPVFDEKMLEVINYMHDRYLCGYSDIMRAVAPPGTAVRSKEWLTAKETPETEGLSAVRKKILSYIKENGGAVEKEYLRSMFESDISSTLREMLRSGQIERQYRSSREISDRRVPAVREPAGAHADDEEIQRLAKRAPAQARLLDIIAANDYFIVSELLKFTGASRASLNALVKRGSAEIFDYVIERNPFINKEIKRKTAPEPTEEQKYAIEKISGAIGKGGSFLIHGVTGSGKTEVFLQSIAFALEKGKSALVLVPEISLTPQMISRFLERFGSRVAVFHSGLSRGERYDQWKRIKSGRADIVIGARSAVFAPLDNIGIIIMDEEHSETYKSEMSPRYHAGEIAAFRAKQYGAALVLASATPSLESYYKARSGEYELLSMKRRINEKRLPAIAIADMRRELAEGNRSMFSGLLYRELKKNIENKEQTILFLNRRGFSTFVSCRSCGYTVKCPNCNISLTYHKFENRLKCHYCGYTTHNYTRCPECASPYIRYFGGGTQRVEEEVHRLFPQAKTIRMDVDTTGKKQSHEKLLERFVKEKADVLVGTQMVAKGLDFENVTLVGVVSADTMLHINDYRSAERTFAMLEQVTGRAGRGAKSGRAVIQTYSPEAEAIKLVTTHDYAGFYRGELETRRVMWYPPFSRLIAVLFSGEAKERVPECAGYFMKRLGNPAKDGERLQILGPAAAAVSKINNKYRWQLVIKCADDDALNEELKKAELLCMEKYKDVSVVIDKNPNMIN